ncbi:MAG TPA: PAS domain S-box protein [Pirellulaceae bacterium]|nr:PAS domain S-box protein [Pirellulaceae bacterium]HMP68114.1 PAS domain S-box protein [Pirellulaceae bacterium]
MKKILSNEIDRPKNLDLRVLLAIYESVIDSIVMIDANGLIQLANQATSKLFGYTSEELIGQNVSMLMPQPYRNEHDGYIQQYLQTHQAKIIGIGRVVEGLRKDGTTFPIHLAVSDFEINGRICFTGIIRDISDLKAAEERLVATQEKLLQKERLAAIGLTVTGLAHESRNALQRSHACLEILALELSDMPDSLQLVRKVQTALDDLHLLMEEVRNYAAPIVLEYRAGNLPKMVEESWRHVQEATTGGKLARFELHVAQDFPEKCQIDVQRVQQVLRNILENATQECDASGNILVQLEPAPDQANRVRISISDSGRGIPAEQREQVFSPFFTTRTKGTGLGLAISKRIVDAHDGQIYVTESQLGGARFVVELPNRK